MTGAWVQQFAIGYVQLAFRPSIDGVEPCNYLHSHGLVGDFEFDRHLPGTVVGHRLRIGMGVALGAAESPEDCGGIRRGPAYWPVAFTYGLDIHAPLPGILHGLSLGPFLGPQAQIFIADKLTNDKSSKATDTAVNLAALGGAHLRFRYGRPEIGFHAYADVSYFYRQGIVEKSWTGVYRRAELKLAYKSVGLLGFWEERVDASGGESGGPNVAALLARTASLAAMRGVALTIDY